MPENEGTYRTLDERGTATEVIQKHEYVDAMEEWNRAIISNDREVRYFGFDMNLDGRFDLEPVLDDLSRTRSGILRSCEMATTSFFGGSSTAARHPLRESFGVIALPATKRCFGCHRPHKGLRLHIHLHGFIRCPRFLAPMPTTARLVIYDDKRRKVIEAPPPLVAIANALKTHIATENLWIANTPIGNDRFVALPEADQDFRGLRYLAKKAWKEDRHWEELDFLPKNVFKALSPGGFERPRRKRAGRVVLNRREANNEETISSSSHVSFQRSTTPRLATAHRSLGIERADAPFNLGSQAAYGSHGDA